MATIKLKIYVTELVNVMSNFDVIHIQRSKTAPPTVTEEDLTNTAAMPATLTGTEEGPYTINAKTFVFKINGTQVSVTFTSPDPVALPDVITEVQAAIDAVPLNASASDSSGKLELETDDNGTQYTLEIISGSALAELGFTIGDKANGQGAHITLVVGTELYEFNDGSGEASYYYRSRFINTTDGTFSSWSEWVQGTTSAAIDSANLIVGKVKLADLDGTALVDKKVVIVNVFDPIAKDGYGVFGRSIKLTTDSTGYAETALVKGATIDVIFSGTSIVRRIVVPTSGTEFDLLDDSLVTDDALEIQVPDLPYAPRRS